MAVEVTTHTNVYRVVPESVSATWAFGGTGTFVFTERRDALEYRDVSGGKILVAILAPHTQERIDDFATELLHVNEWREGDPVVLANDGSSRLYPAGTQLYVREPSLFSRFGRRRDKKRGSMNWLKPPRMQMVWEVLEAARDAGDKAVVDACTRLIDADRRGWRKHHDPADWRLIKTSSAE